MGKHSLTSASRGKHPVKNGANSDKNKLDVDGSVGAVASGASGGVALGAALGIAGGLPGIAVGAAIGGVVAGVASEMAVETVTTQEHHILPKEKR